MRTRPLPCAPIRPSWRDSNHSLKAPSPPPPAKAAWRNRKRRSKQLVGVKGANEPVSCDGAAGSARLAAAATATKRSPSKTTTAARPPARLGRSPEGRARLPEATRGESARGHFQAPLADLAARTGPTRLFSKLKPPFKCKHFGAPPTWPPPPPRSSPNHTRAHAHSLPTGASSWGPSKQSGVLAANEPKKISTTTTTTTAPAASRAAQAKAGARTLGDWRHRRPPLHSRPSSPSCRLSKSKFSGRRFYRRRWRPPARAG